MPTIGLAQTDITPQGPVWLTGYGNREHKSEGVYQPLRAGAVYLGGTSDQCLILTADLIGYGSAYSAAAKAAIGEATGLLPRQIILSATHTHCAPFFYPWIMPGHIEAEYADQLHRHLVDLAVAAQDNAVAGKVSFSRATSGFGVNRRLPNGEGGIHFAPNPDGPMDRDLDTLWFEDAKGHPLGSLTVFGCHPTSLGGYLIGGDYPGYLCRALERELGGIALFATGCAGNIRPWFKENDGGFARPSLDELESAAETMATDVLKRRSDKLPVDFSSLRADTTFNLLPYTELPTTDQLAAYSTSDNPLQQQWAALIQAQLAAGSLPRACPQEIQALRFNSDFLAIFLAGEVLTEIGLHLKRLLAPATTITAAYCNGLIAYVPGEETYPLGGYEVDGSYFYFLRPAPFSADIERRIVSKTAALVEGLR